MKLLKRLLIGVALLVSSAYAQVTPNLSFAIPPPYAANWNLPINGNFTLLDQLLSGNQSIPALSVKNLLTAPNLSTWSATVSYPSGAFVFYLGQGYYSLGGSNLGNLPTNATYWHAFSGTAGSGTVTGFSFPTSLGALFTCSVANPTTSPAVTCTVTSAPANSVYGNFTGGGAAPGFTAAPTFSAANLTNFPPLNQNTSGTAASLTGCSPSTSGSLCYWNGTAWTLLAGNAGATNVLSESSSGVPSWAAAGAGGTVTGFSAGTLAPFFTTGVASATTNPALTFTLTNASQNSVLTGPSTGGAGPPAYTTTPVFSAATLTGFPTFNQNTTGNAATATALAALGTPCSAGQGATGVNTLGTAVGCTVYVQPGANSSITSLGGLTTPLSVSQGGIGSATAPANSVFGNFTGGLAAPGFTAAPTFSAANLTNFPTFNQNTTGSAASLLGCSTATAGALCYWNGSAWVGLPGNTTSTNYLSESASGVPSWAGLTGGGTVTSFSAGSLSPLFTTGVASASTTPALTFTLSSAAANTVFSNSTGASAAPGFTATPVFSAATLTNFPTFNQSTTGNAATATALAAAPTNCGAGNGTTGINASGAAQNCTVYVQPGANSSITSITGLTTPLTIAQGGTGAATVAANTVFGNSTGGAAAPGFTATPVFSAATLTNFPTFNQNTTGNAATANAATTATTATNVAGGVTGSIHYQSGVGVTAMLAPNTAATDQVLVSHGTGSAGNAPTFSGSPAISAASMTGFPTFNQNTTGTAANLTGCAPSTAGSLCYWNGTAWTLLAGNTGATNILQETSAGVPSWVSNSGGAAFSALTGGTNTTAAMLVGAGASLGYTSTGVVNANQVNGAAAPASAGVVGTNSSNQLIATTNAVLNTLITTLTGCNTANNVYTPQAAACVAPTAASSFSSITAGTNAAALVMGTGGSLGVSGTGIISATSVNGNTFPASAGNISGGIDYHPTTSSTASSALLTQYGVLLGGGAGAAPTATAASTTATQALFATATAPAFRAMLLTDLPSIAAHTVLANPSGSAAVPTATVLGAQDVSPGSYAALAGTATAYTVTMAPAVTSYTNGLEIIVTPNVNNTGAGPTINVNGLGAKTITKYGNAALAAGDLITTAIADLVYDGTNFELTNPATLSSTGSTAALTASEETVTSSATPTFSIAYNSSVIVLTANVTSFTLASGANGQGKTLTFCQNSTGGYTVAPPTNVHGFMTVGSTLSKCSSQHLVYNSNQTAWLADSPGVINE